MELTLQGHPSFRTEGSVTVELPAWMNALPAAELDEAITATNRDGLILAAGRHPSGDIVFLTGDGQLSEIKQRRLHDERVPQRGEVVPCDFGQTIRIEDGTSEGFEIGNLWALDNAMGIMFLGALMSADGTRLRYG